MDEYLEEYQETENVKEFFEREFQYDQIKQALSQLDTSAQEIIFLRFIEEKSYEEISDFL
ncbi:MAG: sigma-70 family RNA polymerase sigma factor [Candidatus Peribacteria bacterium]|nr:MAG: sigma-70 family RNA polymerase sigma factor [Candidatus Peribacteria bacterium]